MALVELPKIAGTPKTVVFQGQTANAVVYTVPTGKTWVGTLTTSSGTTNFSINGISMYISAGSYGNSPILPVTLTSGSVVTFLSNNSLYGFGVES